MDRGLGAAATAVYGTNNKGQMVGSYGTGGSINGYNVDHGFVDNGGTFTSFDVPYGGVAITTAIQINDKSQIVGAYQDSPTFTFFGFIVSFQ